MAEPMKRELPKEYVIRQGGAVTLPDEVLAFLGWQVGDKVLYELDLTHNRLTVSKSEPKVN